MREQEQKPMLDSSLTQENLEKMLKEAGIDINTLPSMPVILPATEYSIPPTKLRLSDGTWIDSTPTVPNKEEEGK